MAEESTDDVAVEDSTALCRELNNICTAVAARDAELKGLKKRKKELSQRVAKLFLAEGRQNTKLDGKMFALRRDVRAWKARGFEMTAACEALTAAGLEDFVTPHYSASTLTAYVREELKKAAPGTAAQDVIPAEMQAIFKADEEFTVIVTNN